MKMDGKEIEEACSKSERGSMGFWKRGGEGEEGKKEEREREGEGNQMHAQFNRFPEDPLNAALKASATNRSNL